MDDRPGSGQFDSILNQSRLELEQSSIQTQPIPAARRYPEYRQSTQLTELF
jgi:hypothetical protein